MYIQYSEQISNDAKTVKEKLSEADLALVIKDITKRVVFGCVCLVSERELDGVAGDSLWRNSARELISYDNIGDYLGYFAKGKIRMLPYLRPMESMTEDERAEIRVLIQENYKEPYGEVKMSGADNLLLSVSLSTEVVSDYLDSRQFDWRGLIPKGLAVKMDDEVYDNYKRLFKASYAVGSEFLKNGGKETEADSKYTDTVLLFGGINPDGKPDYEWGCVRGWREAGAICVTIPACIAEYAFANRERKDFAKFVADLKEHIDCAYKSFPLDLQTVHDIDASVNAYCKVFKDTDKYLIVKK
jgi:hypothetical protein